MDKYDFLIIIILLSVLGSLLILLIGRNLKDVSYDHLTVTRQLPVVKPGIEEPEKISMVSGNTEFETSYLQLLEKIRNFKARNRQYLKEELSYPEKDF
jgi:hypothetical protein